ncbi:glycosyltransferase family 4 protein [Acholeplasma sp. OttesenSCG-928-E16]|nr:glycosyltransferase family 4 protein [Acholeplasma sp. OttesenSCG-928-E16]
MRKILFVANVAKEHILKFHVPTIKKLTEEGWIVDVACNGDEVVPYVRTQYKMKWKRNPISINTLFGIRELRKILEAEKYDIVYCHTPTGGVVTRLAARKVRKSGTKVVYFAHGLHFFKKSPLISWLLFYPIEKYLSRFTDVIITINQEDFELVKERFNIKHVYLLPGVGIKVDRFKIEQKESVRRFYRNQLNIDEETLVLIYVAEVNKNKNQKYLLKAISELTKTIKNVVLLLVGPDHSGGKTRRSATKMMLDSNIKFLGWRSDIPQLLCCSDVYVASSIREGFGINLIEAMAAGLPAIATRNRGHSTIIDDGVNGYLVDLKDFQEMKDCIIRVVENKIETEAIIKNALHNIFKYDQDAITDNILEIFKKVELKID